MKRITLSILLALVITVIVTAVSNAAQVSELTDKLIRLHVVANSDSEADQSVKLLVRDEVLMKVSELCADVSAKEEAKEVILNHLDEIRMCADNVLAEYGFTAECRYERVDIDKREYEDFTLPAGIYDALCIRIGKAEGENWWCVVYPSLCLSCAVDVDDCDAFSEDELVVIKQPEKVKYKLFCFELFQKIITKFEKLPRLRTKLNI